MSVEIPIQFDLFTGEPVVRRSKSYTAPAYQLSLFPIHETFVFGERVRPYLADAPKPTLTLIQKDPRTQEEIDEAVRREALTLMTPMFGEAPTVLPTSPGSQSDAAPDTEMPDTLIVSMNVEEPDANLITPPVQADQGASPDLIFTPPDMRIEPVSVTELNEDESALLFSLSPPKPSKLEHYQQVISVVAEQHATLQATRPCILAQRILLSVTLFDAKAAGLSEAEIASAMAIGEFRGRSERQQEASRVPQASTMPVVPLHGDTWMRSMTTGQIEMAKI